MFTDNLFNRIEKKTNIDRNTIMNLAKKLQESNMKDEKAIREVIKDISSMTGKNVSKEKEDKIVDTIINDKVPKDIDKMF